MRNKRLISTAASLFVLVQCGALGHAGEDDLNDRGSEKSFAWLQSRCQQGGGWRSSSLPEPPYFTRIPVETFYRAAACSVAVPSLIFVSMDDQAEDVHAWTNAAAMVREQEQLAQPREGSGWRQGAPYPNELTLGILADLTGPSARDLARSLRLPADASAVLLAAFSTNDHAEGLVFLALPVLTHQTAPTETRCEDEKADTLSCVAMRLAKALAPTYHAHNVALHLHSLIQKPSCLQQPDHQEYAGDSDFRTTTSATATQSSSSSREDLRCIWGAAVTVLAQGSWPPPRRIPASLLPRFSMNGSVPIHYADSYRWEQSGVRGSGRSGRCFARGQGGLVCRPTEYQQEHIQALQAQAKAQVPGYYVDTDVFLFKVLDMLGGQTAFEGLRVGVIGSVEPWYEAICLAYGAAECVSIDYNAVHYRHSRLSWMSVEELTKGVTQEDHQLPHNATRVGGLLKPFDLVLSISSVEHDGLGRYGDALDPDADLHAMRFLQRVVSEGGRLIFAVPVGGDLLRWNMHRIYGEVRLPQLLQAWTILAAQGFDAGMLAVAPHAMHHHQPVFVLENTAPSPPGAHAALQRLLNL